MHKLLKILLYILAMCSMNISYSQTNFQRTFGGVGEDNGGNCIQKTVDGNFIIIGLTASFGTINPNGFNFNNTYVIKVNSSGDTIWTKSYGSPNNIDNDNGLFITETLDSGFISTGYTSSFGAGKSDVYLIKTNNVGDTLWTKTYGGTEGDIGSSVHQTRDGGFIVCGGTSSFGAGKSDVYLIKTNNVGDTLWTKTYGGTDTESGKSLIIDSDGGFVIIGNTWSFGTGSSDALVLKTDSLGNVQWSKTYGGNSYEEMSSVYLTSDGGYLFAGESSSFGAGNEDILVFKTNSLGSLEWSKTYGNNDSDGCNIIKETDDGGILIAGYSYSFGAGNRDAYLIKTNNIGDTLWTKSYGGTGSDNVNDFCEMEDGRFLVLGEASFFGLGSTDVYLFSIDSLGNSSCNQSYGTTIVGTPNIIESNPNINVSYGTIIGKTNFVTSTTNTHDSLICEDCTKPIANFDFDLNNYDLIVFDSSQNVSLRLWDFGDSSSSNQYSPTHIYTDTGSYKVCLTVYNDCGIDSTCRIIEVENIPTHIDRKNYL
ncbi:MAG: PKD domain-containing protein [Chitinophagales bacterium]